MAESSLPKSSKANLENELNPTSSPAAEGVSHPNTSVSANFIKRIVATLVLAPVCVLAVVQGGVVFKVLTAICAIIAACEWAFMVGKGQVKWKTYSLCGVFSFAGLTAIYAGGIGLAVVSLVSIVSAIVIYLLGRLYKLHPLSLMFGAVYVTFPFGAFVYLRELSTNTQFMMFAIFAIVWGTDTAGYLAGKAYGGPLLAPKNSPNKTWTGAIGGVIYAALAGAAAANLTQSSMIMWLFWAIFLSIAAQQGDLIESMFKRKFGIKDMSNIIPGHGGLLDRLDGLMAAVSIAAIMNLFFPDIMLSLLGD